MRIGKRIYWAICLIVAFMWAAGLLFPVPGCAGEMKKVFIVASYEHGHICGGPQEEGTLSALAAQGFAEGENLQVERYYMDTKRKNTTPGLMRQEGRLALEKIKAFGPDVVVTIDDTAFREIGLALVGQEGVSVVFSGLNGQVSGYNKIVPFCESWERPGKNVTGVFEKLHVEQSLKVMQAIPELKGDTFVFITGYSPTGKALAKQFSMELVEPLPGLKYRFEKVKDWAAYMALIREINDDDSVAAIYPVALSLKVDDALTYGSKEIFAWTIANSTKPEMAANYFFSKVGFLGGAAVDFKKMGGMVGNKVALVLKGSKAGSLPIEDARDYAIVFNVKRARQLGINIPAHLLTAADYVYQ